ncbi:hydrolase or acyltransferase of alpha beta superfamily [Micractinium conductrix]|uniref:Hydrolase or acyltransferase of alpha beta superfamily n=1 Tax=Micractinium conductrix TaxID=554055 RepID=A0A2P6VEZ6_9CHLO|nr:hydrolase or acyltransferase of alpha beta superfamily [Micractinium conductrix]|eukprot:PSC72647.1 hydrolase or acyltransferase of alpha beta superfamily [Micractinium conductrix]
MTGEVIAGTAMAPEAPDRLEAGGLTWAYRREAPNPELHNPAMLPVLCLHGIGSTSYIYRNTLRMLGESGHEAVAVDWPGHGGSSKPTDGSFDYSEEAYVSALQQFVAALGWDERPFVLMVHGYVLGQYGMLYALENTDSIKKLIILNTPVGLKTPLRPELAAYKNPIAFLRPKKDAKFAADLFNAAGGPYAMAYRDAQAFAAPYEEDAAASAAVHSTMEKLDWQGLLQRVDRGYESWRRPSLVLFGTSDQFIPFMSMLDWLETKRTCMKVANGYEAKLGHAPQEDYAEAIHKPILKFIEDDQ